MKRFGIVEDREFEIVGEVFRWVIPYWEDMANAMDGDVAASSNGGPELTVHDTIADLIKRIELFIDPDFNDGVNRWRQLTKRKKNPIPYAQYAQVYQWLWEVTSTPTPTELQPPLEDGQLPTAAT